MFFIFYHQKQSADVQRPKKGGKKQLMKVKVLPKVGDLCYAKVRSYSEWPAIVTKIESSNRVWVKFFNSTQM